LPESRPALRALSARLGIEPSYHCPLVRDAVEVSLATHEALVTAMGFDAASEAAARRSLAELDSRPESTPREGGPCVDVDAVLGGRSGFGLWANLYGLRSERDPGFGTFAELDRLVREAGREGAAFVGINPLHALASRDGVACPYYPESRFYRSPLYLDLTRVPEYGDTTGLAVDSAPGSRDATRIDPAGRERAIDAPLRALHARFRAASGDAADARRRAFAAWRAREGEALERYATFAALAEHLGGPRDWRVWPERYRDPTRPEVADFGRERHSEVERQAWVQFEIDRQLGRIAASAREAGLSLGIYADLALGSTPGGADPWSWPRLFVRGVSLGAPPDAFSRDGQDWGLPPIDPHALRAEDYAFFERLLESNLRHVGALRIDHALGLRRLFWIPEGASPRDGAYVRQPEADLFAVIGEASRRHGVVIVAEDLGNVPDGFSEELQRRGMLSSRVVLFERDAQGYRAADDYPRRCLATLDTHDLPPLAAWLSDADLALRRTTGQLPDDASLAAVRDERRDDRSALARRLRADGLPDPPGDDAEAWLVAITRFLARSPVALFGIAIDDLAGETEPINLPGVSPARHPSWLRRSRITLEALFRSPSVRHVLDVVPVARRAPGRVL
jgi:4-alpha-glucanotransferase